MAKTKEVAVASFNTNEQLPDYMKQDSDRGSENVGIEDLTIPRLEIVQSLSPARDKKDPNYITGAEEGMLYNNVSRELFTEGVFVVPVIFKKQWLIWKDRDSGGGFRGAYDTQEDAGNQIANLMAEGDAGPFEDTDTAQHLCLILSMDGANVKKIQEIAISMSKSKMKISRQWNSMIRMLGGDRFSRVFHITAVEDTNDKNQKFGNFHVVNVGFTPKEVYKIAEQLYNDMASGVREMKVNQDQDEETAQEGKEGNPEF